MTEGRRVKAPEAKFGIIVIGVMESIVVGLLIAAGYFHSAIRLSRGAPTESAA